MQVLYVFFLSVVAAVCAQTLPGPKHDKKVVCYLASWSVYRPGDGKFTIDNIEPGLCTHLVYSFAGLDQVTNTIKSLNPWEDLDTNSGKAGYIRLVHLKRKYPHLKVTLAVGGWDEGSQKYSAMAAKPESREAFIKSVLEMLDHHKFDGLDLHWKYPTLRDGNAYDKENYVFLVKELSEAFKPHGYILTAAFGANKNILESAYDLDKVSPHLDLIHVLCYDYHGTWDMVVGANAPLNGMSEYDVFSVTFTVNYLLAHGVSPSKIVLGIPIYGRTFVLTNPNTREIEFGSTPASDIGISGPYTKEPGFMGYNEICMEAKNSSHWEYHWHEKSSTPYLRDGEKVITYDNGRSVATKVKMVIDKELGGVVVWSIDMDDFKGECNESDAFVDFVERYERMVNDPLLKNVAKNLGLPNINQVPIDGPSYVVKENHLHLRLPEPKLSNFALMQTINDAITLSIEEKRIEDEIVKIVKENGVITDMHEDSNGSTNGKKIFCYFASWAVYRPGPDGAFTIEDLEPSLCTHIVYAFAGIDKTFNTIRSLDTWQDFEDNYGKGAYKRIVGLKQKYHHLKVMLAVGGWSQAGIGYSNMAANPEYRRTYVRSVVAWLKKYNFDGLSLDWVYPTMRGGKEYDRQNFVSLVKELSEAFKPHNYILAAAFAANKEILVSAYDVENLAPHLDVIQMMTYDYHGSWDKIVGANAPLKGLKEDDHYNIEYSINYMLHQGVPPNKLVLGLPFYGRTYILTNPNVKVVEFGSTPARRVGFRAPYSKDDGFISFNEICIELSNQSSSWTHYWHEQSSTPYLRNGEKVISYDNARSIARKVKFAVDKGLGGVMVWSIDFDDFKGYCNETDGFVDFVERYQRMINDPLLKKALKNLYLLDINRAPADGPAYVLKDNHLHLRLPQPKLPNFVLMRTINHAMSLAIEEKRIEDEMNRIMKENEVDIRIEGEDEKASIVRVFIISALSKVNKHKNPFFQLEQKITFRFD